MRRFFGFLGCTTRLKKTVNSVFFIKTASVDPDDIENEVGDPNSKGKLCSRQEFLVDSEPELSRLKIFIYALENFIATIMDKKFDQFFSKIKRSAELKIELGLILKTEEMEDSKNFNNTKTKPRRMGLNLCAPSMTWPF